MDTRREGAWKQGQKAERGWIHAEGQGGVLGREGEDGGGGCLGVRDLGQKRPKRPQGDSAPVAQDGKGEGVRSCRRGYVGGAGGMM